MAPDTWSTDVGEDRSVPGRMAEIGLLLPYSVIAYETNAGRSAVAAMAPIPALGIVGSRPELQAIASEADERLLRVLAPLESS